MIGIRSVEEWFDHRRWYTIMIGLYIDALANRIVEEKKRKESGSERGDRKDGKTKTRYGDRVDNGGGR